MDAQQAKQVALNHRKRIDENLSIKKQDAYAGDVKVLSDHFKKKIEEHVNKGALVTDSISFPADRFSDAVITEVTHDLRKDGFHINMERHIAYGKVIFTVSWS